MPRRHLHFYTVASPSFFRRLKFTISEKEQKGKEKERKKGKWGGGGGGGGQKKKGSGGCIRFLVMDLLSKETTLLCPTCSSSHSSTLDSSPVCSQLQVVGSGNRCLRLCLLCDEMYAWMNVCVCVCVCVCVGGGGSITELYLFDYYLWLIPESEMLGSIVIHVMNFLRENGRLCVSCRFSLLISTSVSCFCCICKRARDGLHMQPQAIFF